MKVWYRIAEHVMEHRLFKIFYRTEYYENPAEQTKLEN
jgi:hypothetical protein